MRKIMSMFCFLILLAGCSKFLDKKPNQSLSVPDDLSDLQMLMDEVNKINGEDPNALIMAADEMYISLQALDAVGYLEKEMYTWDPDEVFMVDSDRWVWGIKYSHIFRANLILENLDRIKRKPGDEAEWKNVKGQALFLRARSYFLLANIFTLQYDPATASTTLGLPLRLEADFNQPTRRHTLQQTYDRIIADLKEAIELLPDRPLVVLRSSKPAAQALLARVYMSMRDYENCLKYANDCLAIKDDLIDYNGGEGIAQGGTYAFTRFHPEVIFESLALPASSFYYATVDSVLYDSYNDDDLRKTMFFAGRSPIVPFKGNYASTAGSHFSGHATDEVFLMRAECLARKGQTAAALTDLNHLLVRRWKTGTFVPFTAATAEEALDLILLERRKELVFRGVRWMDLKRLNKEGRNIELVRNLDGQIYRLAPNDLRYAMAIPKDIIQMTGIAQNPR